MDLTQTAIDIENAVSIEEAVAEEAGPGTSFADVLGKILSPSFFISIGIIILAFLIFKTYKHWRKKYMDSHASESRDNILFSSMAYSTLRGLITFLAIIAVLQVYGINVTTFVTGLGLASAIFGLALQDILKDAIMGLHIKTDDFFSVGDVVRYNNIEGEIISFTMKSTKIKSIDDNSILSVCNRNISEIVKLVGTVCVEIPLSYNEDAKTVHTLLADTAQKCMKLEGVNFCDYLGTQRFDESAIIYLLKFTCDPKCRPAVRRRVIMQIQDDLGAAGISIPYNQLDIHNID